MAVTDMIPPRREVGDIAPSMGLQMESLPVPVEWDDASGELVLLDQRLLPAETRYLRYNALEQVYDAIRIMVVRGAPAIGIAAAYGVALGARQAAENPGAFLPALRRKADYLASARPTAVNLRWAVERMMGVANSAPNAGVADVCARLLGEAKRIHAEDIGICRAIGETLLPHLRDGMGVLTHCNAGQLATSRYGTALAPIYLALESGMRLRVYADETRPRLQGATLTAYELSRAGADVTVLCDNMAASAMAAGLIDCCIVGCDRVALNGDTANKIGTLSVAILAAHYGIPFYVAAPSPTIDMRCETGESIPIEHRDPDEVAVFAGQRITPKGVRIYNPSFDVTPHTLITAFATERGLVRPPFKEAFMELKRGQL